MTKIRKRLLLCDEEGRAPFTTYGGDVLSYIGFLSLEDLVWSWSTREYVKTVSRYHEDCGFASPTKTWLVTSHFKDYENNVDRNYGVGNNRVELDAIVMRRVVELGMRTGKNHVLF